MLVTDNAPDVDPVASFRQAPEQNYVLESLKNLTFRGQFNRALKPGVLPTALQHLKFGALFDQPLERGVLPDGLQSLAFSCAFNSPLVLRRGLKHLEFHQRWLLKLLASGALPKGLRHLSVEDCQDSPLGRDALPEDRETLNFECDFNGLFRNGDGS